MDHWQARSQMRPRKARGEEGIEWDSGTILRGTTRIHLACLDVVNLASEIYNEGSRRSIAFFTGVFTWVVWKRWLLDCEFIWEFGSSVVVNLYRHQGIQKGINEKKWKEGNIKTDRGIADSYQYIWFCAFWQLAVVGLSPHQHFSSCQWLQIHHCCPPQRYTGI